MSDHVYLFEIETDAETAAERGEIEARDEAHARRLLAGRFGAKEIDRRLLIADRSDLSEDQARARADTLRYMLHALGQHRAWLADVDEGARGDLSGLNLSGLDLSGRNLAMVNFAYANLEGSDLRDANLQGADLSGASAIGADLRGADLSNADLSDCDLRGAHLSDAKLAGTDLWRANLSGAILPAEQLHAALGCKVEAH